MSDYSVIVFATDRSKWFVTSRFLKLAGRRRTVVRGRGSSARRVFVVATDRWRGTVSGATGSSSRRSSSFRRARRVTLVERERYMTVLRLIRR